jgi:ribose/xylose/arabinose/galactoside ABC-type transport system permease subunit
VFFLLATSRAMLKIITRDWAALGYRRALSVALLGVLLAAWIGAAELFAGKRRAIGVCTGFWTLAWLNDLVLTLRRGNASSVLAVATVGAVIVACVVYLRRPATRAYFVR